MPVAVLGTGDGWLSLVLKFAASGLQARGITRKGPILDALEEGALPRAGLPPSAHRLLIRARANGALDMSSSAKDAEGCEAIVLVPELPVDRARKSVDVSPLGSLIQDLGKSIEPGSLVVVACRVPPGTVVSYLLPLLERATGQQAFVGVFLAAVPERVHGAALFEFPESYNRVIGRADATSAKRAIDLYKRISRGELDLCDIQAAAIVAASEGAVLEVHRALSTEIALACDAFGASPSRVRELLRKSPVVGIDLPPPAVGEPGPTEDTTYLKAATVNRLRLPLIDAADSMVASVPRVLARLTQRAVKRARKDPKYLKVAVLGIASQPNSATAVGSPALAFLDEMGKVGFANLNVHDALVSDPAGVRLQGDVGEVVSGADVFVLFTPHDSYLLHVSEYLAGLPQGAVVVDARGVLPRAEVKRRGLAYVGIAR